MLVSYLKHYDASKERIGWYESAPSCAAVQSCTVCFVPAGYRFPGCTACALRSGRTCLLNTRCHDGPRARQHLRSLLLLLRGALCRGLLTCRRRAAVTGWVAGVHQGAEGVAGLFCSNGHCLHQHRPSRAGVVCALSLVHAQSRTDSAPTK
jgi:hypothetical protein